LLVFKPLPPQCADIPTSIVTKRVNDQNGYQEKSKKLMRARLELAHVSVPGTMSRIVLNLAP